MATVLYGRVSTAEQTIEHQRTQAEKAGFRFDHVLFDTGVSGVSVPLRERPEGRRLFDLLRRGDVLVVRWVDRLGRNYEDVTDNLRELMRNGVVIRTIINDMTFDGATDDPIQKAIRDALIAFLAASAQSQAEATRVAQRAGIDEAKKRPHAYRGRKPSFDRNQLMTVQDLLAKEASIAVIAKETKLSRAAIYRIREDPASAERTLALWEPEPRAAALRGR